MKFVKWATKKLSEFERGKAMGDTTLNLKRRWLNPKATIGELYIDGDSHRQCLTLELPSDKCIPVGTYQVILDYSNRFQRIMPHIMDVPGFTGIRIHFGNDDSDTEGCVLVGQVPVNDDFIGESRAAFAILFDILATANQHGKISMIITNEPYPPLPEKTI